MSAYDELREMIRRQYYGKASWADSFAVCFGMRWLCSQIDALRAEIAALEKAQAPSTEDAPLQRAFEFYDEDLRRAVSLARERDERDRG